MITTIQNEWQQLSDEALVALCVEQLPAQTGAFDELWYRYHGEISGFCQRFLRDAAAAADACQAVFVQVFRHIARFENRSSFRTWLYTVARNACLNVFRSSSRHDGVDCEDLDQFAARDELERDALARDVQQALSELPRDQQIVVRLRYEMGMSLEEIAQRLDLGLSATKMRLYRGQSALKEMLEARGYDQSSFLA